MFAADIAEAVDRRCLCSGGKVPPKNGGMKNGKSWRQVLPELRLERKRLVRNLSAAAEAVRREMSRVPDPACEEEKIEVEGR